MVAMRTDMHELAGNWEPRAGKRCHFGSGCLKEIVQVPRVEHQEEIVEQQVEQVVTVQRTVEVLQIQKWITQQPVEQIVEEIVQVPKVECQEEIVERQVEQVVTVQRTVEVPQIQERIIQQPVEQIIEKIVQVPVQRTVEVPRIQKRITQQPVEQIVEEIVQVTKIQYEEEILERQVEQVITVPKYVEVPQIQERMTQVPTIETVERIVEVPRDEIQERLFKRPIEEIVTVPRYVEVPRITQKVTNHRVEQFNDYYTESMKGNDVDSRQVRPTQTGLTWHVLVKGGTGHTCNHCPRQVPSGTVRDTTADLLTAGHGPTPRGASTKIVPLRFGFRAHDPSRILLPGHWKKEGG